MATSIQQRLAHIFIIVTAIAWPAVVYGLHREALVSLASIPIYAMIALVAARSGTGTAMIRSLQKACVCGLVAETVSLAILLVWWPGIVLHVTGFAATSDLLPSAGRGQWFLIVSVPLTCWILVTYCMLQLAATLKSKRSLE